MLINALFTSGLVNPTCTGIIGNGVVVHVPSFFKELEELEAQGTCIRDLMYPHPI